MNDSGSIRKKLKISTQSDDEQKDPTERKLSSNGGHVATKLTNVADDTQPPTEIKQPTNSDVSNKRCQFFIQKKQRFCKMQVAMGRTHCSEHSHVLKDVQGRKRIPCPLDPKHTCYEDQLLQHMKHCNARPGIQPKCYSQDINLGPKDEAHDEHSKISLKDVSIKELSKLIDRMKVCHKVRLSEEVLTHSALQCSLDDPSNGVKAQKHLRQQASLIGHLEKKKLLNGHTSYVEFGAGRGGLSHWVQLAVRDQPNTHFLLVDKSSVRYKMDSFHKGLDQGPTFERLKIDIAHLNLSLVESLDSSRRVVGLGKHLCGAATDFMLRCLVETFVKSQHTGEFAGLVLALCCHHRCDWRSYVGQEFMTRSGFTPRDFHLMTRLSSWALSGTRDKESESESEDESLEDRQHIQQAQKLSVAEREEVGFLCKDLINEGRKDYLERSGMQAELVCYVERERTLENVALLATQQTRHANV